MSKIGDFIAWIFICMLLIWFAGLIFSTDKCTRVHRSAWPVIYGMGAVESLSENWVSAGTKLKMLRYKANGAVAMQNVFEKTVYGDKEKCTK
ncbi:hypothetical protein [Rhodoferax antarcticus]|uniref:hypothetical protein n=1 Tax=Rhodoferax antarcticus TaxID=81479 RepID=UPI00094FC71A|nr:hypothetical protein [Rhodoferax antarcticus]